MYDERNEIVGDIQSSSVVFSYICREARHRKLNEDPPAAFFCKQDYSRLRGCCFEARIGNAEDVSFSFKLSVCIRYQLSLSRACTRPHTRSRT